MVTVGVLSRFVRSRRGPRWDRSDRKTCGGRPALTTGATVPLVTVPTDVLAQAWSIAHRAAATAVRDHEAEDVAQDTVLRLTEQNLSELCDPEFEDALLTELDRSRSGQTHDVVSSLQAAQSPIMRAPLDGILLVQGAPVTGKTVFPLNWVSWLLCYYADDLTAAQVLVGPTPAFNRYISDALPALGYRDVRETHIDQVYPRVTSALRIERT